MTFDSFIISMIQGLLGTLFLSLHIVCTSPFLNESDFFPHDSSLVGLHFVIASPREKC